MLKEMRLSLRVSATLSLRKKPAIPIRSPLRAVRMPCRLSFVFRVQGDVPDTVCSRRFVDDEGKFLEALSAEEQDAPVSDAVTGCDLSPIRKDTKCADVMPFRDVLPDRETGHWSRIVRDKRDEAVLR